MKIKDKLYHLKSSLPSNVVLVAVSKTKPVSELMQAYDAGQRIFGENKVQEMTIKRLQMPKDVKWHMIGHLQRNKVKYLAPFVSLIHGVDRFKLLSEINKHAKKNNRIIDCLLQIKISDDNNKFGMSIEDAETLISLDDFESEILKGMLIKKYDSYNKIVENTDMSKQARQEGLKNLEIEFIKSLSVILSPDEITTYVDTDFSEKDQKKKNKRRKRRKNKA